MEKADIKAKAPGPSKVSPASKAQKTTAPQSSHSPIDHILNLQRTVGNQAVHRLFRSGMIQAKLKIGAPNDIYEQEADRVADQVMRTPDNTAVSDQRPAISGRKDSIQMKPG